MSAILKKVSSMAVSVKSVSCTCLMMMLLLTVIVSGRPHRVDISTGELVEFLADKDDVDSVIVQLRDKRNVEVEFAYDQDTVTKAIEYFQNVIKDHACADPQPRVLPVQELHPRSEVSYATVNVALHRCAYDSGCCELSEICAPKHKETVHLPILMYNSEDLVSVMPFVNHTACHCVSRKEYVAD